MPSGPTVLVADDMPLVRNGIKLLIANLLGDVRWLEAHDGDSLLRAADSQCSVDLAVVDLKMRGMEGGSRLIELARRRPNLPLIVMSGLTAPNVVRRIMRIHTVHAFVSKSAGLPDVQRAIESAMRGHKQPSAPPGAALVRAAFCLTPRQEEVRALLRMGMSNKMIAGTLGISEGTVKNHVTEILRVLDATNRTQAAQINFDD